VPRLSTISLLECYLHEELGWWLYSANGWVGNSSSINAPSGDDARPAQKSSAK